MEIKKTVSEVRSLCIKNDWFTCGSNSQYERMFKKVRDGADVEEVATIIWICSENVTKEEIINQLVVPVRKERVELVRAMELIARAVNDEDVFMTWLISGVADGDINEIRRKKRGSQKMTSPFWFCDPILFLAELF
jgi:hypothetical protein